MHWVFSVPGATSMGPKVTVYVPCVPPASFEGDPVELEELHAANRAMQAMAKEWILMDGAFVGSRGTSITRESVNPQSNCTPRPQDSTGRNCIPNGMEAEPRKRRDVN